MKMLRRRLQEWLPIKLVALAKRRFSGLRVVDSWPTRAGGSWHDAAGQAAKGYKEGIRRMSEGRAVSFLPGEEPFSWSEGDLQFHNRIVQFGFVAAKLGAGKAALRILDFGGSFGVHAIALKRLLPHLILDYTVCEIDEFCEIGRQVNKGVHFVSSLGQSHSVYDLVYASGSVQYLRAWSDAIHNLCGIGETIFITRTPFVLNSPTFITIQRAYGTEYPGWVFNYYDFVEEFKRNGMALKEVFLNGGGIHVWRAREQNIHLGLLFERTNTP